MGKTKASLPRRPSRQKHPHARGEDAIIMSLGVPPAETPPRTWGRRGRGRALRGSIRNTPTHVGKTLVSSGYLFDCQKHPHARGEDFVTPSCSNSITETPPRTWGRPLHGRAYPRCTGNTPTHVGKTLKGMPTYFSHQKHPHARGEDSLRGSLPRATAETPPRTWGRHQAAALSSAMDGNTPTHVRKTNKNACTLYGDQKHPHARGEDPFFLARDRMA